MRRSLPPKGIENYPEQVNRGSSSRSITLSCQVGHYAERPRSFAPTIVGAWGLRQRTALAIETRWPSDRLEDRRTSQSVSCALVDSLCL